MGSASDSPFCASDLALKVTSNRKTFNIKCVRLVKTVKFAFGLIFIRGRLWPMGTKNRTDVLDLPKSEFG